MENILDEKLKIEAAIMSANLFEMSMEEINHIRKDKPEQFINSLLEYTKTNPAEKDWKYLFHRLKLTANEFGSLFEIVLITMTNEEKITLFRSIQAQIPYIAESGKIGNSELLKLSVAERRKKLEKIKISDEEISLLYQYVRSEITIEKQLLSSIQQKLSLWNELVSRPVEQVEPSGEELLKAALQKIKAEKNIKNHSELDRFVKPRIKKAFPKKPKDFTKEQVREGMKWFIETRKKIAAKKELIDQRSRSRVNVPPNQWSDFMFEQFGERTPVFTAKYQKKVRDETSKLEKHQAAQSSSK